MIDKEELLNNLSGSGEPWQVEVVDSIDSTNDELVSRYTNSSEVPHLLLWADAQTSGRGRIERKWQSIPGKDITASLIFPAPVPRVDIPKLSLSAGMALVNVLRENLNIQAYARWPNDVVTSRGKISGNLSTYLSTPNAVVCGIGINVNSEPEDFSLEPDRNCTTLHQELGKSYSREALLAMWVMGFEKLWPLADKANYEELKRSFDAVSFYLGKKVKILIGAQSATEDDPDCEHFSGTAGSISMDGSMLIELSKIINRIVSVDDVIIPLD